jgi:hypothetical protein
VLKKRRSGQRVLLYESGIIIRHTEEPGGPLAQFNIDCDTRIQRQQTLEDTTVRSSEPIRLRQINSLLHYRTAFRSSALNRKFRPQDDRTGIETRTEYTVYRIAAVV